MRQADDPGEIVAAFNFIKNHPEESLRMGGNGRKAVENEFNWLTQEANLLALYEEMQLES